METKKTSQPNVSTSTSMSTFPSELAPYMTDILERAKKRQETKETEGFQQYGDPRIAATSDERAQAQSGVTGLVNNGVSSDQFLSSGKSYLTPALGLAASSAGQFDQNAVNQYMSPYMQNVIDVQKREAGQDWDTSRQGIRDAFVGAGGFGGSRQAILESENERNRQQQLGDIQATGLQQAFGNAQSAFEAQKQRELGASKDIAGLGQFATQQAMSEMGALESVGAQKEAINQQGLNLAFQDWTDKQSYPDRILQDYQSIVRGFPMDPNVSQTGSTTNPTPSLLTQAVGAGATGLGLWNAISGKAEGGSLKDTTGLQFIKRAEGGEVDFKTLIKERMNRTKKGPKQQAYEDALTAASAERAKDSEEERKGLTSDKWLELAKLGANITTRGAAGEGLLKAASGAAPDSIDNFSDIKKRERSLTRAEKEANLSDAEKQAGIEAGDEESQLNYAKLWSDYSDNQAALAAKTAITIATPAELMAMSDKLISSTAAEQPVEKEKIVTLLSEVSTQLAYKYANDQTAYQHALLSEAPVLVKQRIDAEAAAAGKPSPVASNKDKTAGEVLGSMSAIPK